MYTFCIITSLKSLQRQVHSQSTLEYYFSIQTGFSPNSPVLSPFLSCLLCTLCSSHIYLLNPCLPISWFSGLYPNNSLFLELPTSKTSLSKPIYSTNSNMKLSSPTKHPKISPLRTDFPSVNFYSTLCLYFGTYCALRNTINSYLLDRSWSSRGDRVLFNFVSSSPPAPITISLHM